MQTRRVLGSLAAAAALIATLGAATGSGTAATTVLCRGGAASGVWSLPHSNQDGSADGFLYRGSSTTAIFHLTATLHDVPSPCLSCIEGTLTGFLDDGVGSGPDYFVDGRYLGSFFGGTGNFHASVYSTSTGAQVGRIGGEFADTDPLAQPGTFHGRWRICD